LKMIALPMKMIASLSLYKYVYGYHFHRFGISGDYAQILDPLHILSVVT
jgi:hypothetical protein